MRPVTGDPVNIRVDVTPPQRPTGLTAFAESDGHRVQRSVASPGTQTLSFPISGPDDSANGERLALPPGPHVVRVGVSRGSDGERWQRAYDVYVWRDGSVTVLAPGLDEHVADFGRGPVTIREHVDHVVRDVP